MEVNLNLLNNKIMNKGFGEIIEKWNYLRKSLRVYVDIRNNDVE